MSNHNHIYRVRVLCNWSYSRVTRELTSKWLAQMADNPQECRSGDIQFVEDGDGEYDYTVILNKPMGDVDIDKSRTIIFHLEPWCYSSEQNWGVKTWGEWANPQGFLCVRNHRTYMNMVTWQLSLTKKQLLETHPLKTRLISTVTSEKYFDPGHIFRIDLLRHLDNVGIDLVDIYGRENYHNLKGYKGRDDNGNKDPCILPYKYYLHAENNAEYNYITEKLWDGIMAECVCFYWGCPNVGDYIDPACYILLDRYNHVQNAITIQNAVNDGEWEKRIVKIREQKHRLLTSYNVFTTVRNIIEAAETRPFDIWISACKTEVDDLHTLLNVIRNNCLYDRVREIIIGLSGDETIDLDCFVSNKIKPYHICGPRADAHVYIKNVMEKTFVREERDTHLYLSTGDIIGSMFALRQWKST